MGNCIQQGDLLYSAGLHRNHVLATANTGKIERGFGEKKMQVSTPTAFTYIDRTTVCVKSAQGN